MSTNKIPCINCITLPICKVYLIESGLLLDRWTATPYRDLLMDLLDKCSLLDDYCVRKVIKYGDYIGSYLIGDRADAVVEFLISKKENK